MAIRAIPFPYKPDPGLFQVKLVFCLVFCREWFVGSLMSPYSLSLPSGHPMRESLYVSLGKLFLQLTRYQSMSLPLLMILLLHWITVTLHLVLLVLVYAVKKGIKFKWQKTASYLSVRVNPHELPPIERNWVINAADDGKLRCKMDLPILKQIVELRDL